MTIADNILSFYQSLQPPQHLPLDVEVLNPYKDVNAWSATQQFYQKYYNDQNGRIVLFGINPGRFGGGITGVPFTDPIQLETSCEIENTFDKRAELSSGFIYEVIAAFGGPIHFYKHFYISAMSPLGYVSGGKNLNYYDIPEWKPLFDQYSTERIKEQLSFPLHRKIAFSIGQGENVKFLEFLNKKNQFFDKIITLPHPRWVMQYRLKRKAEFIEEYVAKLSAAIEL